jgi:hypothetical protein
VIAFLVFIALIAFPVYWMADKYSTNVALRKMSDRDLNERVDRLEKKS